MAELSVVLTYYQREKQLLKTLESFRQYDPSLFTVVIVDDNSPDDIQLPAMPYEVAILKVRDKHWINSGVTYNIGFHYVLKQNPRTVIIQNAECYHAGDIIGYTKKHLSDKNYLSFACYSLAEGQDTDLKILNNKAAHGNGDSAWYNHSVHRPEAFHFCSAITAENLKRINGFDERFAFGIGFDDNYFIWQVKTSGLKVEFIDDPFVVHQYHYDVRSSPHVESLYMNNSHKYEQLKKLLDYRAKHTLTPDL